MQKINKVNYLFWFILLVFVMLLSSCAIYVPQVSPPVSVEKQGETQLNLGASISLISVAPGANASVSYALTDKIQTQVYASFVLSGPTHLQMQTGYDFRINDRTSFRLFGGYFYGIVSLKDVSEKDIFHAVSSSFSYTGTYQSVFGKLQYTGKIKTISWGSIFTVGYFKPDILERVHTMDRNPVYLKTLNQNGSLFELYLYFQKEYSNKFGINFYISDVWIEPLDKNNPDAYKLNSSSGGMFYNFFGNMGVGMKYMIKSAKDEHPTCLRHF